MTHIADSTYIRKVPRLVKLIEAESREGMPGTVRWDKGSGGVRIYCVEFQFGRMERLLQVRHGDSCLQSQHIQIPRKENCLRPGF